MPTYVSHLTTALSAAVFFLTVTSAARAEVTETKIEYSEGSAKLVGFLYSDDKITGKAPGVVVFSDWMGVGQFAKDKARELAGLGYRAFVADVYGDGKEAKNPDEAGQLAGKYKGDRPLMRKRAAAGLDIFLKKAGVDPKKVAAIGFCFGGTVALELARSGGDLAGVVTFHGGLATPNPELAKNIRGKVLVLHGADDPYVADAEVKAFEDEMRSGKVNWELVKYSNSVHAFTNPAAGTDNSKGAAYNEQASQRSFERARSFYKEIF